MEQWYPNVHTSSFIYKATFSIIKVMTTPFTLFWDQSQATKSIIQRVNYASAEDLVIYNMLKQRNNKNQNRNNGHGRELTHYKPKQSETLPKWTLYQKSILGEMIVNRTPISATSDLLFLSMEFCHAFESWTWKYYCPEHIVINVFLAIH